MYGKHAGQIWGGAFASEPDWLVFRGLGQSADGQRWLWSSTALSWDDPLDGPIDQSTYRVPDARFEFLTADVNGDGLPDHLHRAADATGTTFFVAYNNGSGFEPSEFLAFEDEPQAQPVEFRRTPGRVDR